MNQNFTKVEVIFTVIAYLELKIKLKHFLKKKKMNYARAKFDRIKIPL